MKTASQRRLLGVVLVAAWLVVGCATVLDSRRMNIFADTSKNYGKALLWGHYEAANLYRQPEVASRQKPDFEKLRNIKVTQYDVRQMTVSDNGLRIDQEAEIAYYHRDKVIVKTLRDQQVWEFDTGDRRWYLTTGLPEFP